MSSSQVKSFDRLPLGCLLSMDFIVRHMDEHGRWIVDGGSWLRRTRMESSTSCGLGIHLILSAHSFQPDRAGYREYSGALVIDMCVVSTVDTQPIDYKLIYSLLVSRLVYLLVTCLRGDMPPRDYALPFACPTVCFTT